MELHLIFARANGGVIGKNNALPWHLPEDLAHFKRTTLGQPVIMGRKTWDSLPERFRPLPGRTNVVVTRQPDWTGGSALRADSLQQALSLCSPATHAWVIGGAQLYAQALPLASSVVVTEIELEVEGGDAFAPALNPPWQVAQRADHTAANGLNYRLLTYRKTEGT